MKKYILYIFIAILLYLSFFANKGLIEPAIGGFVSVANLNSGSIDDFVSKSIEFSFTVRDRFIDHIESEQAYEGVYEEYGEDFYNNNNNNFSYVSDIENFTILGNGDFKRLFEESDEFKRMFNLPVYFENYFATSKGVLRTYYISASDFAIIYPNMEGYRVTFDDLYKKYLFVDKATNVSSKGTIYVYDVHEDAFTGKNIISIHTPINIDNKYYGSIVVDIETSVFDDLTLKNFSSFATSENLNSVIYSDEKFATKYNYTGGDILESVGITRDFKKRFILYELWIENLKENSNIFFQGDKVIFQSKIEAIPIEYYQVATYEEIFHDVLGQLGMLTLIFVYIAFFVVYLIYLRLRDFLLRKEFFNLKFNEQQLLTIVNTDFVTGLKNDRFINMKLENLNENTENCYSIAICDISFYSETVEIYGDKVAQKALIRFIESARSIVSEETIIARWNDDQLIFIFHEVEGEGVVATVDEVRKAANMLIVEVDEKDSARIVVSFGVASNSNKRITPVKVLEEADRALHTSLKRGGNIVTIYSRRTWR